MSTLWAVSSGEYSDYSVNAVFDTEEDARAAIALGLGEQLEEMDYYRSGDKPVKREIWIARSYPINADGSTDGTLPAVRETPWGPSSRPDRPKVSVHCEGGRIWITVEAPTKEMAEKVLHDRVAKARAERLGL